MSLYPETPDPMRRPPKLKLWKQLKPLYVDKISLLVSRGDIRSNKSRHDVKVTLRIGNFYRLSVAKNIHSRRTTSRLASPPEDGRGLPKCFQDFGKFYKVPIQVYQTYKPSQAQSLLAGFALRRKVTLNILRSHNKDRSVSISLIRKGDHSHKAIILSDLALMDPQDPSSALSLMDLIADPDFDTAVIDNPKQAGFPRNCTQELDLYLQDPGELSPPSRSLPKDCPIPPNSSLLDLVQTYPAEVIIPADRAQSIINLRQTGLNHFEVVVPRAEPPLVVDPELDLGYVSPPSSPAMSTSPQYSLDHLSASTSSFHSTSPSSYSSHSSPFPTSPPSSSFSALHTLSEEMKEEKRLREQREACRRYRDNRKRKREGENQEVEILEMKKRELEMKVEVMEEMLARMRETVLEGVAGKRKRKDESEEREEKVRKI